jgi:UDP-glucose 4-epimerase
VEQGNRRKVISSKGDFDLKKRILITGINSYVGKSLETWLGNYPENYEVNSISLRNDSWKELNFSKYDSVVHVAGIAHVSTDPNLEQLYYKVNRDLTIDVAKKSKSDGVKQFIFMSSIIVYGDSRSDRRVIDKDTVPIPSNFYGNSKLLAEEGIKPLENDDFKIVIVRPPMIYGRGSKGNYPKLSKLAQYLPVFPEIENQRSMLHIDNLCEFLKIMIDNNESGLFFPQNKEYVNTSEMVSLISNVHGKKIILTKIFNPAIRLLGKRIGLVNKVFGNLVYEKKMSSYKVNYQIRNLSESIIVTENSKGFDLK